MSQYPELEAAAEGAGRLAVAPAQAGDPATTPTMAIRNALAATPTSRPASGNRECDTANPVSAALSHSRRLRIVRSPMSQK
jgi:hypothetical protein